MPENALATALNPGLVSRLDSHGQRREALAIECARRLSEQPAERLTALPACCLAARSSTPCNSQSPRTGSESLPLSRNRGGDQRLDYTSLIPTESSCGIDGEDACSPVLFPERFCYTQKGFLLFPVEPSPLP
jgi:hypothetical protein